MGLDVSHGCWHGAYSAFMRWRCEIARAAGLPPLELMEGFYGWETPTPDEAYEAIRALGFAPEHGWARDMLSALQFPSNLPISWDCLKPSPLYALLHHSDCEGDIAWELCAGIADELEKLIPLLPEGDGGGHIGNWREKTRTFIAGLRMASERNENVIFY